MKRVVRAYFDRCPIPSESGSILKSQSYIHLEYGIILKSRSQDSAGGQGACMDILESDS